MAKDTDSWRQPRFLGEAASPTASSDSLPWATTPPGAVEGLHEADILEPVTKSLGQWGRDGGEEEEYKTGVFRKLGSNP